VIAGAPYAQGRELGTEVLWMTMLPRERNGEEPPEPVAAAMRTANVVVAPTTRSLTHTRARREACAAGARVATMPGVTEAIACRAVAVDYTEMARRCEQIAAALGAGKDVRVTTGLGTDLTL